MITIHTRHFPSKSFHAITLFPFIFYNGEPLKPHELRHEGIHLWQQAALLLIGFYLLYLLLWLINIIRYRDIINAYYAIPFERSAYALEGHQHLKNRQKAFDWLKRFKA